MNILSLIGIQTVGHEKVYLENGLLELRIVEVLIEQKNDLTLQNGTNLIDVVAQQTRFDEGHRYLLSRVLLFALLLHNALGKEQTYLRVSQG
jgi:hypothetical protein